MKINCKNRNIVIINEELFIKTIDLEEKEINKEINKFIIKSFGEDKDYLFHTIITKDRKRALIYVIKAGNRVDKLCEGAKNIKVIPIQFIIKDKLKKIIKETRWVAIIYIFKKYYILDYNDNFIINSYIEDNIYNIDKQILKLDKEKPIYISKNINMKELSKDNKYLIIKEEVKESDIFNKKFLTL